MITRDKGIALTQEVVAECLKEFLEGVPRMKRLRDYYAGRSTIAGRIRTQGLPNNRLVHGYPQYIATMTSGYLIGDPVMYIGDDLEPLQDAFAAADVGSVDAEIALNQAIFGRGVELVYADSEARPRSTAIDPQSAFVVYADDAEGLPLFGVYIAGKRVFAYLPHEVIEYERTEAGLGREVDRQPHSFPFVPLVEYWNNSSQTGDFEQVISLIDAYDVLQSDRINDKEQFADALLVLYGVVGLDSSPDDKRTPAQRLKQEGTLALPDPQAKAEYLIKSLNEADTEVLKDAIKADIHKFSLVPDLTDEQFAGNSSGVAMRFKLLGLEQLTKIKERWFREGLRWRLRLYTAFLAIKGAPAIDADAVQMQFRRSLPVNDLEVAQMVQTLNGLVPSKTLLAQVPFVENVEQAYEELQEEKQASIAAQAAAFGAFPAGSADEGE